MSYKDREVQRQYQKEWFQRNKEKKAEIQRKQRAELRRWFEEEILPKVSCQQCGENHPACMDFHHRNPAEKDKSVSYMLKKKFSKQRTLNEMAKCDVLCSNCHRKYHWLERKSKV